MIWPFLSCITAFVLSMIFFEKRQFLKNYSLFFIMLCSLLLLIVSALVCAILLKSTAVLIVVVTVIGSALVKKYQMTVQP